MLDPARITLLKEKLAASARPLFMFHDDPDGSTSFMQLYRYYGQGKGVIVKTGPRISSEFLRRIQEFGPDAVFILDIALVDEEFIKQAGVPIVWIDHHGLQDPWGSLYINPRQWGQTTPPCYLSYQLTEKKDPWLALIGCIGDWFEPPGDLVTSFRVGYPGIVPDGFNLPEDFMFKTRIGQLVHILSFNLKGKSDDAMTAIKIFSRLEGPMELLEESTPQARFLLRRYRKVLESYTQIKQEAISSLTPQKGLIGVYTTGNDRFAVCKDLANEISYLFPHKTIILGREKAGEIRLSMRSGRNGPVIDKAVERALAGIQGHGGGHEHACGAIVAKEDFQQFVENMKRELCKKDL